MIAQDFAPHRYFNKSYFKKVVVTLVFVACRFDLLSSLGGREKSNSQPRNTIIPAAGLQPCDGGVKTLPRDLGSEKQIIWNREQKASGAILNSEIISADFQKKQKSTLRVFHSIVPWFHDYILEPTFFVGSPRIQPATNFFDYS